MEAYMMNADEVNLWKCLTLLESERVKSEEMMYDMLCESIVKQKGVSSVAVLKQLEKTTGKPPKGFKNVGQGSPTDFSSEDGLRYDNTTPTPPYSPIQMYGNPTPTKAVQKSLSTKTLRVKRTTSMESAPSEVLSDHTASDSPKIMKMQQKFKELFNDYDST